MRHLNAHACSILREGKSHTVVVNSKNSRQSSVPRHKEVATNTVRAICKQLEISSPL